MIDARGEDVIVLEKMPFIYYPVQFRKEGKAVTKALINSDRELNIITLAYAKQLGPQIQQTNIRVQNVDNLSVETFKMIIANFQVVNKLDRVQFF